MLRQEKEQIVEELTTRLRETQTLIVADYRGLTMKQIDALRTRLLEHGGRLTVVKNTLTRRAAEAAGADAVLTLLDGPTAIAFLESGGDPVAVAKALSDTARETRVLEIRGGILDGKAIGHEDVRSLATLPPLEQLRGQVLGAVSAPLTAVIGLFAAPLQNLVGVIDARIEQLGGEGAADEQPAAEQTTEEEPAEEVAEATSEEKED